MNAIPREYFRFFEPEPIPEARPLTHGFESIDWTRAPLAQRYGVPGVTHWESSSRRKKRRYL